MDLPFANPLAVAAGNLVKTKLASLNASAVSERYVLSRIAEFPFAQYPDYCLPWHLLAHERMRWDHVALLAKIIENLRQPTGGNVGKPIGKLLHFQMLMLLLVFGPEADDGKRLVKEALFTIGRKNAKTTTIAGVVTALMGVSPEQGGLVGQEIQVGAADRNQAGITHKMVERFVAMDETIGFADRFRSVPSKKTVVHSTTLTQLECLSSDAYRAHGSNPAIVLLDELGNVPGSVAEEFYGVLTSAFGAQPEPLTLMFSTQAETDTHVFSQQVDRAKRVNTGVIEDNEFAGFVFAVPVQDEQGIEVDIYDERWWPLANPGLGAILSWDDMRNAAKRAKELPSQANNFRRFRLNQRVTGAAGFLTRSIWNENGGSVDIERLVGQPCYAGLDLSETTDLSSLVLVFEPIDSTERFPVLSFFWIPGDGLQERSRRDHVPYSHWLAKGYVAASPGPSVSYRQIAEKISWAMDTFIVGAIGYDRYRMKFLRHELKQFGHEWDPKDQSFMVEIQQGFITQTRTVELLEDMAVSGRLIHGDNPVLNWNVANTVVVRDPANNRKFDKAKSYGRIDGTVALGMALHARDIKALNPDEVGVWGALKRTVVM